MLCNSNAKEPHCGGVKQCGALRMGSRFLLRTLKTNAILVFLDLAPSLGRSQGSATKQHEGTGSVSVCFMGYIVNPHT